MNISSNLNKIKYYMKRYGFFKTFKKVFKRVFRIQENRKSNKEDYQIWIDNNEIKYLIEKQRGEKFEYKPKISVVVPMYNTDEKFFKELIESLETQTYSNWELCLADGSPEPNKKLNKYFEKNDKIKYTFLNENLGISENTNEAINLATGDFIGFLDHDDILAQNALYEVVREINENPETDFIYSDEDKIDENYERFEPYFKPEFSPETLECNNYITHFVVVKKELIDAVGKLNPEFNGAQDFDFVLRCTEKAKRVAHISKILYHWRVHLGSTALAVDSKPYAFEAGVRAAQAHIERVNKPGKVEDSKEVPGIYKIKFDLLDDYKVSILIPNKDNVKLLKKCINSILKLTTYENYEICIIENNSEKSTLKYYEKLVKNPIIKVLNYNEGTLLTNEGISELPYKVELSDEEKQDFNYSRLINFGVKNVDGDFVLQLNNDTVLITPDWLELMIGYAQYNEIGAVGARLYYQDKTIQHAGIIVGLSGIAGNSLVNLPYGKHAYYSREAATRNCLAVTGACLFARRELYEKVNYMDEENFKVAFNDVDFCLKLADLGYRNVYNPYVELYHLESKSRGYEEESPEKQDRFDKESNNFKTKWQKYILNDPYYNKNFTRTTCNYDIKIDY